MSHTIASSAAAAEAPPPQPPVARGPADGDYTAVLYWGRDGLERISQERERFARTLDAQRLADFIDWYASYLETRAADPAAVVFCAAFRGDAAAAIVPLQITSRRPLGWRIRGLEIANDPRMPSGDAILGDGGPCEACLTAIVAELSRTAGLAWDYIRLANLLDGDPFAAVAGQVGWRAARTRVSGACSCPVLPEAEMFARLSRNFRRKLRTCRKKAATAATFHTASATAELEAALAEFLAVEASGWKGPQGSRTAILCDPPLAAFYREVLHRFGGRGRCAIHLLRVGPQAIAGQYTLVLGDTVYVLKIGYDEEWRQLSPGVTLFDYLFRISAENAALKRICFTTEMPWMVDWRPSCEDVFDVFLYRRGVRGLAAQACWWLRRVLRYHRLRWAAPLYRSLIGSRQRRYRRRMHEEVRDEQD